jgi:hypothetical protein
MFGIEYFLHLTFTPHVATFSTVGSFVLNASEGWLIFFIPGCLCHLASIFEFALLVHHALVCFVTSSAIDELAFSPGR